MTVWRTFMFSFFQIPAFEMATSRVVVSTWLRGTSLAQLFHDIPVYWACAV